MLKTRYRVQHQNQRFFPGIRITAQLSDAVINRSTHTSSQWFKTNQYTFTYLQKTDEDSDENINDESTWYALVTMPPRSHKVKVF